MGGNLTFPLIPYDGMNVLLFMRQRRFAHAIAFHMPYGFNLFSTQAIYTSSEKELEPREESKCCLSLRIERLPREEPIGYAFQRWMGDGLPIHRGEIFHAIDHLRRLKLNKRALEMMEWVIRERPYRPNEQDYSYLLEFTIKHHGISDGEKLFSCIPCEFQNKVLYNNLVMACLYKGAIRLSLDYMKKMRELGHPISHLTFDRMIVLHSSPGRRKMIRQILSQMKADKVAPHVSTYNILLKIEARDHNIAQLEKVLDEMRRAGVEPDEVTFCILAAAHADARLHAACEAYTEAAERCRRGDNWSTLDILIMLHGFLGNEKKLRRAWELAQEPSHVLTNTYVIAIEAFGRVGDLDGAEAVWEEMKLKKKLESTAQFNSILSVYCRRGLVRKAAKIFREMEKSGCKPNGITHRHLALGCLEAGLVAEASRTLDLSMPPFPAASKKVRNSSPWLETTFLIMERFADQGDLANAERFFAELSEARYTRHTFVFNTLLKAYVKAKIHKPDFLRRMILGGAKPDSETYSLIKLTEQFLP